MDCGKVCGDSFFTPVPPANALQCLNGLRLKALADWFCGNAADYCIRLNILCNHCPCAYNGTVTDGHARKDYRLIANPNIVAYYNIALIIPRFGNILDIKSPFLKENRKRISCKRGKRVVCGIENEFCSAGNRTEFADNQPVVIDGIMVKNIVFSKSTGLFTKSLYIV